MRNCLFAAFFFLCSASFAQSYLFYVPYNKKGLWGYADTGMVMRVAPFSRLELGFFNDSKLALTTDTNRRYGLINTAMKTVLPAKYLRIDIEHKKYVKAETSKWRYKLFSQNGTQLLPYEFSEIVFSDDNPDYVLVFSKKDVVSVYHFDNKLKKLVLKRQHEGAGKAEFIDYDHYKISYHYTLERKIYELSTGKAYEEKSTNKEDFGKGLVYDEAIAVDPGEDRFLAKNGTTNHPIYGKYTDVLDPKLIIAAQQKNYYNKHLLHVKVNGKWGVITVDRKIIVPVIYDTIVSSYNYSYYDTKDELKILGWICKLNGKYGLVSTDTSHNIPFAYEQIKFFSAKFIMVKQNGKYGVLNHNADMVIPCEVDSFKYGWSNSLHWTTCNDELILYALKGDKIALYGTKGSKTDYLFDMVDEVYADKKSIYGGPRSVELKQDSLYGLAICNSNGFVYVPCQYRFVNFYLDAGYFRYYKVFTLSNQLGYIDHLGRKYFEE
ncbi:MAG: WG repeat-containing protein [Chitinophagaceae bacterium]